MKILKLYKIKIQNYRQYRTAEFNFKPGLHNVNIIVGSNGTGKTNFLNAINWCLYGDEPHKSDNPGQLPILNVEALNETTEMSISLNTSVEIYLQTLDDTDIIIERKEKSFIIQENQLKFPKSDRSKLCVKRSISGGEYEILVDDEAEIFIQQVLPKRIRGFYFFDGEKMEKYFTASSGRSVYNSMYLLAHIDLLKNTIDNMRNIKTEFERKAANINPKAEEAQKEKEEIEDNTTELEERILIANEQLDIAREKIKEYTKKLTDQPDVESLNSNRDKLRTEKGELETRLIEKRKNKTEFLLKKNVELKTIQALDYTNRLVNEKIANDEIPVTVDTVLVDILLNKNKCICGTDLGKVEKENLINFKDSINLSSISASKMTGINPVLNSIINEIKLFQKHFKPIQEDIKSIENRIKNIENELKEIDDQLFGYDEEDISNWHHERVEFENQEINLIRSIALWEKEITDQKGKLKDAQKKLDNELVDETKIEGLKEKIKFLNKSIKVLDRSFNKIMYDLREEIVTETKEIFFDLHWKKETFKEILIDEKYSVQLIHKHGYNVLGDTSAGESHILALAFIIALHNKSGFDAPIIIDTPIGRLSDKLRTSFAETIANYSKEKQIIILFTPSDYSSEVKRILEPIKANKFLIDATKSESEVEVKIL